MKTIQTLLIFILMLHSLLCTAQNVKLDSINFLDLKEEYNYTVKNNQKVQIKLININRNLYKISGVKVETNYNTEVPAALKGIKVPSYIFTSQRMAFMNYPSDQGDTLAMLYYDEIKSRFEFIAANAQKIDSVPILHNRLNNHAKDCLHTFDKILHNIHNECAIYLGAKNSHRIAPDEFEKYMLTLVENAAEALKGLPELIEKYKSSAAQELHKQNTADIGLRDEVAETLKTKMTTEKRKTYLKTLNAFQTKIDSFPIYRSDLDQVIKKLYAYLDEAKTAVKEMKEFEKTGKIYALTNFYKLLNNPATFQFKSEIITAKTDEIKYTFTVEPTELNSCGKNDKIIIVAVIKVDSGFKMDFSTGVFLNSGNDDFLGNTYYYVYTDADHRKIVTADRANRYLMSVGALMHFYWRTKCDVRLGGSVGVSTTASVSDLLFHAGPSVFIGRKNRCVLTAGLTLKSSPMLDRKLQTDTLYTKLESPDTIPTVSVFPKAGYFFSFTYNFTALPSK